MHLLLFNLLITLVLCPYLHAIDRHVRAEATGANNGTSWTDAWTSFPSSTLYDREDTIYVAAGSYGTPSLNKPVSGTTIITIVRATVSDHGSAVGWLDSYASGQAIFDQISIGTGYYIISGERRDENNWLDLDAYGFRVNTPSSFSAANSYGVWSEYGKNSTISYVATDGSARTDSAKGMKWGGTLGTTTLAENITISRCIFANTHDDGMKMVNALNCTIELTHFGPKLTSPSGLHGDMIEINNTSNIIFRNNSCSYLGDGLHFGINGSSSNGWDIFGNVFRDSGGSQFKVQSATTAGKIQNIRVYNNTLYNVKGFSLYSSGSLFDHSPNFNIKNTLYRNMISGSISGETNITVTTDPFVNVNARNFRLNASASQVIDNGIVLGTTYNTDLDGTNRGSGLGWDVGAFEYNAGTPVVETVVPVLTAASVNTTGDVLSLVFSESVINVIASHYTLDGATLSNATGSGTTWNLTISPAIIANSVNTLSYVSGAGRTSDVAGNLLESFSSSPVTNYSLVTPVKATRKGRNNTGIIR